MYLFVFIDGGRRARVVHGSGEKRGGKRCAVEFRRWRQTEKTDTPAFVITTPFHRFRVSYMCRVSHVPCVVFRLGEYAHTFVLGKTRTRTIDT